MDVLLKPEIAKFVAEKVKTSYADAQLGRRDVRKEQERFHAREQRAYLQSMKFGGWSNSMLGTLRQFNAEKIIAEERQRLADKRNGG